MLSSTLIDDWGLEPLDAAARHDLLEILEERYGRRSTMIIPLHPGDFVGIRRPNFKTHRRIDRLLTSNPRSASKRSTSR
jgi:DNA replication protein DnaC